MKHCDSCTCETAAERAARRAEETRRAEKEARERAFVNRHAVLTDDDLAWAKNRIAGKR